MSPKQNKSTEMLLEFPYVSSIIFIVEMFPVSGVLWANPLSFALKWVFVGLSFTQILYKNMLKQNKWKAKQHELPVVKTEKSS